MLHIYTEYSSRYPVDVCILYLRSSIPYDRKRFSMLSVSAVRSSDDKNKIMMNQLPV